MFAWALVAIAHAADPSPGTLMPGAVPVESGWYAVGGAGVFGVMGSPTGRAWGGGGAVTFAGSPGPRVLFSAAVSGHTMAFPPEPAFSWGASVRYNLREDDGFRVGLFAAGGMGAVGRCCVPRGFIGGGLALEGGGRVRVDASIPVLFELGNWGDRAWSAAASIPLFLEAGVSIPFLDDHRIRIGKYPLGLGVSYRFEHERFYAEAEVATMILYSGATLRAGFTK